MTEYAVKISATIYVEASDPDEAEGVAVAALDSSPLEFDLHSSEVLTDD